jgi:hypothetical protein
MARRSQIRTLTVTALAATCAVSVAAAAAKAPVTLKASPASISFGKTLVLSGKAAGARKGADINLFSHPCGFTKAVKTLTTKTRAKGVFKFRLQPAITTAYRVIRYAAPGSVRKSRSVRVVVRPLIKLHSLGSRRFSVDVSVGAGTFFTGKKILIQRRIRKRWETVASAKLKQKSSPTDVVAVSSATLRVGIKHGTLLRAFLPKASASPCYGPSGSQVIGA